jgi:hypothetical protein
MSYLNLHVEAQQAKQRLTQVFQEQPIEDRFLAGVDEPANRLASSTERRWLSPEMILRNRIDSWKNPQSPKQSDNPGKDMSASSFALTLLLSGTMAAANTDQPLFWLSIGPAPFALALAAIVLLRPRFDLLTCLIRKRYGQ